LRSTTNPVQAPTKILIVEDDRAALATIGQLLVHYGFDVSIAPTLADARAQRLAKPDLIVLDLMLPDGNGIDLLETIRMGHTPTRVFVLTANTSAEVGKKVRRLAPDRIFRKPFNFFQILDAIREAFPPQQQETAGATVSLLD
jgi:DNA-binding response OmpR family regulator